MSGSVVSETVYGNSTGEESHVMSEKVQSLAATVYKEFEKVIKRYDEDVVKDLMPLVVGILETLDAAFTEKQELDVEIELLREDNEQLLTQYEREKQLRKGAEQKYLETEDNVEGMKKELEDKIETLESIVRMSEIKSKNTADHVTRLEEKEADSKNEYNKLHERYTELFRTHMDYMERTKILMGTDKLSDLTGHSPRINKGNFSLPGLRPVSVAYGGAMEFPNRVDPSPTTVDATTPQSTGTTSLKNELEAGTPKKGDKAQLTDSIDVTEKATGTKTQTSSEPPPPVPPQSPLSPEIEQSKPPDPVKKKPVIESVSSQSDQVLDSKETSEKVDEPTISPVVLRRKKSSADDDVFNQSFEHDKSFSELDHTLAAIKATTPELSESQEPGVVQDSLSKRKSVRNDESIFEELSGMEMDFESDLEREEEEEEEEREYDKDSVGDNFFGMGKELENLILENTELLATKNALNIVKDDLIAKVDELSSEQEILREEINSLQAVKTKLQQKISQLEEELKKTREDNEGKDKGQEKEGDEDDVPMAQRKRFTRVEMARVLMERNQYKERLMELQEAVRWTEMIRASKEHPNELQSKKNKSSVWSFFSELVAPSAPSPDLTTVQPLKEIPARHHNVLQAVLNPTLHQHKTSHNDCSSFGLSEESFPTSLLPSPTSDSLKSLGNIKLLPPPASPVAPAQSSPPVPVSLIVPSSLPTLPPTPSGLPAPSLLTAVPFCLDPSTGSSASATTKTMLYNSSKTIFAPSRQNFSSHSQPNPSRNIKNTATLPGIHAEPNHEVKHL